MTRRIVSPHFALLWGATFVFFLSFYLLLPALPLYARTLGIPESQIGFIIGLFAVSSMVVKPVAGWAADRWGRKPLMLAGAALFACSSALYGWSVTVAALLAVRLLHGAGMGLFPTASASMVADVAPAARRGEAMGLWGAAGNVALALGPLGAVWMADRWGFGWLFAISTAVALTALALTAILRETLDTAVRLPFGFSSLLSPSVAFPCAIVFCLMTSYGLQAAFLPIYAQSRGTNPGVFFLVLALVVAVVRGWAGQVSDRLGRAPVAATGMGLIAASLVTLAAGGGFGALVAAGGLYGLGFGAAQPALMAWTVDLVRPTERGKAMGTYYTALELGIAAGAIGFGILLARSSFTVMFLAAAGLAGAGSGLSLIRISKARAGTAFGAAPPTVAREP
ncbi:MAG TPA: MFS transporter [Methylomirabilota bacterium]|nr:MFS transporter [Methylomirabilota bacterium]